jgi:hypothetical protein
MHFVETTKIGANEQKYFRSIPKQKDLVFLLQKTSKLLGILNFVSTWWTLIQKRVVWTKSDIYAFIVDIIMKIKHK